MSLLTFIFVGIMIWALPFMKWKQTENGRTFFFKNVAMVAVIAVCISALAYVLAGFFCKTDACQDGLIAYSIFVNCVLSLIWAIVLFSKELAEDDSSDILDKK